MWKSIYDFFLFIKNPNLIREIEKNYKLKTLISLFLFSLIVEFLLNLFTNSAWLRNFLQIDPNVTFEKETFDKGILYGILTIGVIAPIAEELLFRSYLKNFIWNSFIFPINIGFIFGVLYKVSANKGILILISSVLILSCTSYLAIKKSIKINNKIYQFYKERYWIYFYLSALSFALLHLSNYKIQNFIPFFSILLILPLIFAGVLLGYIRITMGLKWSIYFHSLHNLIYVLIFFVSYS